MQQLFSPFFSLACLIPLKNRKKEKGGGGGIPGNKASFFKGVTQILANVKLMQISTFLIGTLFL